MENSNRPVAQQGQPTQAFVRPEQVHKLPHLNELQKTHQATIIGNLWRILNHTQPSSQQEYAAAQTRLAQMSANLVKGVRAWHSQTQQQQQLQQAQTQGQQLGQAQTPAQVQAQAQAQRLQQVQNQAAQMNRTTSQNGGLAGQRLMASQSFQQLPAAVQAKVNAHTFIVPPNMRRDHSDDWLAEAKFRYGQALQKLELSRSNVAELRRVYAERQENGRNFSQEELQDMKRRQAAADKLQQDGTEFLTKFQQQQEGFRRQQAAAGMTAGQAATAAGVQQTGSQATNTPAPHTINSAVVAARAGQPVSSNSGTPNPQQPINAPGVPIGMTAPTQPQGAPMQTPVTQQGEAGAPAAPTQLNPPQPLTHQIAMQRAASNQSQQQQHQPPQAHPVPVVDPQTGAAPTQEYVPSVSRPSPAGMTMKTMDIKPPRPVAMPPARPTLSGGPSHNAVGMLGQPAIQKHPGYVIEGEGQRMLSKKMLDVLVRQVTGGGEGEGLTPDAEEVGYSHFCRAHASC